MNKRTIGYWVSTGLIALAFAFGGVVDFLSSPEVVEGLAHLGYPAYFAKLLGVWKVLGAVTLVAPGLPRLKEWAYAGIIFDVTAASVSHAASGDDAVKIIRAPHLRCRRARFVGAAPGEPKARRSGHRNGCILAPASGCTIGGLSVFRASNRGGWPRGELRTSASK